MKIAHGIVTIAVMCAPTAALAQRPAPGGDDALAVRNRLAGNWALVSMVNIDQNEQERKGGYDDGRLMYDALGNMAAQLTRNGRPRVTRESSDRERLAASEGYVAYYGTYDIDVARGAITHHVKGSTNTGWIGTDLVRYITLSPDGNRLVLSIKNGERVTGSLTWERLK